MADNISTDYTLLNQSASVQERQVLEPGVQASVTITYTGAGTDGHKITIIDALTNSKTYELDSNSSVTAGNVAVDIGDPGSPSSDTTFTNLRDAINGASGHDGEIIASVNTTNNGGDKGTLTLTQKTHGTSGNTTITIVGTGWIKNDPNTLEFENGQNPPADAAAQFLISTRSTVNIKGQSTTSRYRTFLGEDRT